MSSAALRDLLQKKGVFTVISVDPVRDTFAKSADLRRCNGCADRMARQLGADVAITGAIQKLSNLILSLNVQVKPLAGDAPERACTVDRRGDTDESFEGGIHVLVVNDMSAGKSFAPERNIPSAVRSIQGIDSTRPKPGTRSAMMRKCISPSE